MAIDDATAPYAHRWSGGNLYFKNMYSMSFGYTTIHKKIAAASTTAILAATNGASTSQTITTNITQPDTPRALSVTAGGTAAGVQTGSVVITGTNFEGKVITESFAFTAGTTGTVNGVKAFKSVTSIFIPAQVGSSATYAVGTQNILGVKHRLFKNNTTVKVYTATGIGTGAYTGLTLQGVPTVTASEANLENNTVQPLSAPDGTKFFIIGYVYDNWSISPFQDQPEYSTTTSTSSTSSSTSTTTITTSTSSTSSSTSSTSTSSTSTSISTSSTSTSTTTTP